MPVQGEYMGMMLTIDDVDKENLEFFRFCAEGEFRLQRGRESGLLRYPPSTACPWTGDRDYDWIAVEAKGVVHSYGEVHHPIQPAFKEKVPYMILLVDLDVQRGKPTQQEALRVAGNLVTSDGKFAPTAAIKTVGIGSRVRMVYIKVVEGFAIPHWTVDENAVQPETPWRYPQE